MARKLGLKTQVEIQAELENRRGLCKYKKSMVQYQLNVTMDKYKEYVAKNPHLFKKVTTQTLKKRK
jgi:hypothetical protein